MVPSVRLACRSAILRTAASDQLKCEHRVSTLAQDHRPLARSISRLHSYRSHAIPEFDSQCLLLANRSCQCITHHVMTPIPRKALRQLNTKATIPLAVKPLGSGAGLLFSPLRSMKSTVLPAALPWVGVPMSRQAW